MKKPSEKIIIMATIEKSKLKDLAKSGLVGHISTISNEIIIDEQWKFIADKAKRMFLLK